ncbi:hypothetical protein M885DRAFT_437003 [Pelagophyceae sp. CCMP2097]|nr:hypothetical protein M885DRAFT_437003 [Pelagophyceae sp. CCMP2097]|mmetsp:Transcript_3793/g.11586  ORF Transcript_3793/g.11586 Transcript_3793/m.11586 type:complete len:107 (+) Transcript_3793:54-374(+)
MASAGIHPMVRALYKRILTVGKDYPPGLDFVREKAKKEFFKHKNIYTMDLLKRRVHYGRQAVKEMIGVIQLKKYRAVKFRYDPKQKYELNEYNLPRQREAEREANK